MLGNVVGHHDAKENAHPRKERPENKVDGAIALIMALGRYMIVKDQPTLDVFINDMIMVI
jgi:phage terminase large subunit-like protein